MNKTINRIFLIISFSLSTILVRAQVQVDPLAPKMYPSVLLELFSSEGCSSCPVADQFLQELIGIADSSRSPVFALDYHVDIWNKSGWVDKFSDTSFSRRQREYMIKAKQPAMFTPMMLVNGGGAIAGSAKKEVANLINTEMRSLPLTQITTKAAYVSQANKLIVSYEILGKTDSCSLNLVLAYKQISSEITGGENAGKILIHHHTVKVWKRFEIDPSKKGKVELQIPEGMELSNLLLVSFVQHEPTWRVYSTDQLQFR
jgi:hypothetical protein